MYSKFPFTLDIHSAISQVSIPVTRGDTARRFYIGLTDGGAPFILPEDCRAVLTAEKADGTHLLNDCIIEDGGAVVRYDFTEQTASAVGKAACQIKLYDANGGLLAEPRFTMIVYDDYVDEDIVSTDEKTTIKQMILAEQARVAAENKRIASDAEREEIARRAEAAAERVSQSVDGDDVFIRYSAYSDGRDYTATWRRGLNYIGVAVGLYEPKDARGYQWSVFSPGIYVGGGDMPDHADVQIDPDGESGFELIEAERIKAEEARVGAENAATSVQGEVAKAEAARIKAEQASAEAQEHTAEHIGEWLENHPEATASVKDGSLVESKFSDELKKKAIKDYVTPQMFGAKGDGSDDTQAFLDAIAYIENSKIESATSVLVTPPVAYLYIPSGKYIITQTLNITSWTKIVGAGRMNTVLCYTANDGTPCICMNGGGNVEAGEGVYANVIKDLTITGEWGADCIGVKGYGAHSWKLDNVQVIGCSKGGFVLDECFSGDMYSCYTSGCGDADHPSVNLYSSRGSFDFGCHGVNIFGGEFGSHGVGLKIDGGYSVSVYGTIIEGCARYGIEVGHSRNLLLSGLYFEYNNYQHASDPLLACDVVLRHSFSTTINGCVFMSGSYPVQIDQVEELTAFGNSGLGFAFVPDAEQKIFRNSIVLSNHGGAATTDELLEAAVASATIIGVRGTMRRIDGIDISVTSEPLRIVSGSGDPTLAVEQPHGSLFLRNDGTTIAGVYYKAANGSANWVQMQPVCAEWSRPDPVGQKDGLMIYDCNLAKPLWKMENSWRDVMGNNPDWKSAGTTEERPTVWPRIGYMFFDTTLGKPIWCKETSDVHGVWVDCTGAVV